MDKVEDKHPRLISSDHFHGQTPLHLGAKNGHKRGNLSVCKFIIDNVDDKNPKTDNGVTPLHIAAAEGHLKLCQLIINNVEDKNPENDDGVTPLDCAYHNDHSQICELIEENLDENSDFFDENSDFFDENSDYDENSD